MKSLFIDSTAEEEIPPHPIHARTTVLDEPAPGFFRQVQLSDIGLYVRHDADVVFIPLAQLINVAAKAEPKLVPPSKAPAGALHPINAQPST